MQKVNVQRVEREISSNRPEGRFPVCFRNCICSGATKDGMVLHVYPSEGHACSTRLEESELRYDDRGGGNATFT